MSDARREGEGGRRERGQIAQRSQACAQRTLYSKMLQIKHVLRYSSAAASLLLRRIDGSRLHATLEAFYVYVEGLGHFCRCGPKPGCVKGLDVAGGAARNHAAQAVHGGVRRRGACFEGRGVCCCCACVVRFQRRLFGCVFNRRTVGSAAEWRQARLCVNAAAGTDFLGGLRCLWLINNGPKRVHRSWSCSGAFSATFLNTEEEGRKRTKGRKNMNKRRKREDGEDFFEFFEFSESPNTLPFHCT